MRKKGKTVSCRDEMSEMKITYGLAMIGRQDDRLDPLRAHAAENVMLTDDDGKMEPAESPDDQLMHAIHVRPLSDPGCQNDEILKMRKRHTNS